MRDTSPMNDKGRPEAIFDAALTRSAKGRDTSTRHMKTTSVTLILLVILIAVTFLPCLQNRHSRRRRAVLDQAPRFRDRLEPGQSAHRDGLCGWQGPDLGHQRHSERKRRLRGTLLVVVSDCMRRGRALSCDREAEARDDVQGSEDRRAGLRPALQTRTRHPARARGGGAGPRPLRHPAGFGEAVPSRLRDLLGSDASFMSPNRLQSVKFEDTSRCTNTPP